MKTTFGRTFITMSVLLLAVLLLIGISFQLLVQNFMFERTISDLRADANVLADTVEAYYSDRNFTNRDFAIALNVSAQISGADAVICDTEGKLLLCAGEPFGCSHQGLVISKDYLQKVFQTGCVVDTGTVEGLYPETRYVVSVPILSGGSAPLGIVLVSSPVEKAGAVLDRIADIFIFVSVLVICLSIIALTFFLRLQSRPLREMAQAANAFAHGEMHARINTDGSNSQEVEELALAFNNMAASLQKSEYQRQEFVANVSHELKTPMTTISGYVDGILDGTIPPDKSRAYLQIVSDETKRLNRLVRNMLDISRLQDQGSIPEEKKTRFDLAELSGRTLVTFEQKITARQLQVNVDMPEHAVYTLADEDAVTQVVYNLLDNAVKFCPVEGELTLSVREGGNKAYISISNTGETIPPEELPLLFDRFHKIDKSRSQNRDSWGLGLYIVKKLVDSHGENISVTSRDNTTTFTFTMPLVN